MRKSVKSTALITVGVLLITASAFLTGFNVAEDKNAGVSSNEVVNLVAQIANERKEIWEKPDAEVIPDYILNPEMEMPTVEKDGIEYIGVVELPAQGITLGVASELTMPSLKKTPCRYEGSIYDDTCIIAGHNYQSHFGKLSSTEVGDTVTFTDTDGNVFEYEVVEVEFVNGNDVETMEAGEWDLTLFTCRLGKRTERLTLRCNRVSKGGTSI